jgi:cellulose synthase/poly-beta-1,6-N-acetylglucosamine synthase-like glycosyltransferase
MGDLSFSIIIPCHNEAATIGRKLDNCFALSPPGPVEILVVDDYSTDATALLVTVQMENRRTARHRLSLRLISNRYSPGKAGALQTALEEAKGEIHLVTDADVILDPNVLEKAGGYFGGDPMLGALCLSPRIVSTNSQTLSQYARSYETFNKWLKRFQSQLDSLPIIHGQAMFLRASLGLTPHQHLPGDDVDFAFQVRIKGFKAKYASDLCFYESISPDPSLVFQQKIRRAKAVMRSFWHYRSMLMNPRYGIFGLVCFPLDFAIYFLIAPLVVGIGLVGSAWVIVCCGNIGLTVMLVALALGLVRPLRSVGLYIFILLYSQVALLLEHRPRIRWKTERTR